MLEYCNKIRKSLGRHKRKHLYPGSHNAWSCIISETIGHGTKYEVNTGNNFLTIFTRNYTLPKPEDRDQWHSHYAKDLSLPSDIRSFILDYDNGGYEHLEVKNY